ncbi:MAG: DUF5053 domain-containing protein [Prevotella sp.]|nr:DUF5053 domain-containing protein [Prevotella sp.]
MRPEVKQLFEKCKSAAGTADSGTIDQMAKRMREIATPEEMQEVEELMRVWLNEIGDDIADIKKQIREEDYKLLPISYIAKNYFGKSSSWLYQRINGTNVRGRTYTLNGEQKKVFNSALKEIGEKIASLSID